MTQHVIPPDDDAQTPLAAIMPDAALAARYGSQAADVAALERDDRGAARSSHGPRLSASLPLPPDTFDAPDRGGVIGGVLAEPVDVGAWSESRMPHRARSLPNMPRPEAYRGGAAVSGLAGIDLARLEEIGRSSVPTDALAFLETLFVAIISVALKPPRTPSWRWESFGLGSVYIGAIRNRPVEMQLLLGLPPNVLAVFGLCVG